MSAEPLSEKEVDRRIQSLDIWGIKDTDLLGQRLVTKVEFGEYSECVRFADQVFELAEKEGFYPEVKVLEGSVEVDVVSEDVEGFTERDFELAEKIEEKLREGDWS